MTTLASLRERAATAVAATAERLADPDRVAAALASVGRHWAPYGLADGAPGLALLHAELARHPSPVPAPERPGAPVLVRANPYRAAAHAWLGAASRGAKTTGSGLYDTVPALFFALSAAATGPEDYAPARAHLHRQTVILADRLTDREHHRIEGRTGCTTLDSYDLVSGLAGLGALLLTQDHLDATPDPLHRLLSALVLLTEPVAGRPGWWVAQTPHDYGTVDPSLGHANLGLAHGIPGPLALLALAWQQGVRVPGQDTAIRRMAEWLLQQTRHDQAGPWWPTVLEEGIDPDRTPGRPSWCYGSPGIARALQLAGLALDVPGWRATAETAALAAVTRATDPGFEPLTDAGLCHGWGGLLHCTWRIAQDGHHGLLADQLPTLATRLLELVEPAGPFGFRPPRTRNGWTDDPAGFLTGAAGAALALHTFATDLAPDTTWDRALLLA